MDSGGIQEYNLEPLSVEDPCYSVSRGLGLGRDDGNLFTDERVEQRGFPHIGRADDGGKTGFKTLGAVGCVCHRRTYLSKYRISNVEPQNLEVDGR